MFHTQLLVALVLVSHFLADFVLQTRWMAENKSKSDRALLIHIIEYGLVTTLVLVPFGVSPLFVAMNTSMHLGVDAITSRLSSHYHQQKRTKAFWVTIGADQTLHGLCFVLTWSFI